MNEQGKKVAAQMKQFGMMAAQFHESELYFRAEGGDSRWF